MAKKVFIVCFLLLGIVPVLLQAQVQTGQASYYADKFEGRTTASGEKYKHTKLTAAHRTLPFGTKVRVTNILNNKTVEVRINDRGPYVSGRIIDLSRSAAEKLDFIRQGLAEVKIEVIDPGDGKSSSKIVPGDFEEVEEQEFYDFEVDRIKPKGFGVQIGSYRELVNLVRLSENLKGSYQRQVTVQVKLLGGKKLYTIILGQFRQRYKAEEALREIKIKYPDAFIIDYANI